MWNGIEKADKVLLDHHLRLYNNPGMNPLSPNCVIVSYLLSFYKESSTITYDSYDKYGLALGSWQHLTIHLQVCNLSCP